MAMNFKDELSEFQGVLTIEIRKTVTVDGLMAITKEDAKEALLKLVDSYGEVHIEDGITVSTDDIELLDASIEELNVTQDNSAENQAACYEDFKYEMALDNRLFG